MIIGIPKEIKTMEHRVSLVPAGIEILKQEGHTILVEAGAGRGSGYSDEAYALAGAKIVDSAEKVFQEAECIVKVKEPQPEEYSKIRPGQILFTYFHFAASESLTQAILDSGAIALAYETFETDDGHLPLLTPMSEVAGRMAVQQAAKYLEREFGGKGKLLGGVPGVRPARVLILGGGIVGFNAAKIAAGLGAQVTILDIDLQRLRYLDDVMPRNVQGLMSDPATIRDLVPTADVVVGAVLVHGGKAPKLLNREHLQVMEAGSVVVDVAIDQGGSFETSKPTTHENPIYKVEDIVHYCVTNMPGAVPQTSTQALTNATLLYLQQIAGLGWKEAVRKNPTIARGLNMAGGQVTYQAVADAFNLEAASLEEVL